MSLAELKDQLDIHTGGVDHINIHHSNEIAQSEAATGKKFFNFWLHGAFLNIADDKKMAKSEDNFLTLENALTRKGIDPLVYRFACLQTHYRKPMEYSEAAIKAAENGLAHLYNQVKQFSTFNFQLSIKDVNKNFKEKFLKAVNEDLNMPRALAVAQEALKSKLGNKEKLATISDFDKVLGLNLADALKAVDLPVAVKKLAEEREAARAKKDFRRSDELRAEIEALGYAVKDTKEGRRIYKK